MTEPWFHFLLAVLAAYRLSLLVSKESGPAFIFRKLRRLPPPKSSAREGLSCQWCLSVYGSAVVTAFLWWRGVVPVWEVPLWWLAVSAGAIAINQTFTKGR